MQRIKVYIKVFKRNNHTRKYKYKKKNMLSFDVISFVENYYVVYKIKN